jgi:hypothetical protein
MIGCCEWLAVGPPFKCAHCDQTANKRSTRKACKSVAAQAARQAVADPSQRPQRQLPLTVAESRVAEHGAEAVEVWSLAQQAGSLASAQAVWAAAGFPLRCVAEQQAIEAICRECPRSVKTKSGLSCGICGCAVVREDAEKHTLKIRMATTHCPDKPARW